MKTVIISMIAAILCVAASAPGQEVSYLEGILVEKEVLTIRGVGFGDDGPTIEIFNNEQLLADSGLEKPLCMQNCPVCGKKQ